MTYGVLTILLGLVIFLVTKLLPAKLKGSVQTQDTDQNSENKNSSGHKKVSSPEKLAQWILQTEKTKTNLKEKLCRAPIAPH